MIPPELAYEIMTFVAPAILQHIENPHAKRQRRFQKARLKAWLKTKTGNDSLYHYVLCISYTTLLPREIVYVSCSKILVPYNAIRYVPFLPTCVKEFYAPLNMIRKVQPLPHHIQHVNLESNWLTKIPQIPRELLEFRLSSNCITEIPELPDKLEYIDLRDNPVEASFLPIRFLAVDEF